MPELTRPGVYVDEVPLGNKTIIGVETSTAGFVGGAERGPLAPTFVSSWPDFQRSYGGYVYDTSFLAYAVEGFFANGGQRCVVSRVAGGDDAAVARGVLSSADGTNELNIAAIGPGSWGTRVRWSLARATEAETDPHDEDKGDWVKIDIEYLVHDNGHERVEVSEVFDNVGHGRTAANNIVDVVNGASRLVRLWWRDADSPTALALSAKEHVPGVIEPQPKPTSLEMGADATPERAALEPADFEGSEAPVEIPGATHPDDLFGRGRGLRGIGLIDEIAVISVPDAVHPEITDAGAIRPLVLAQCDALKDRFAIFAVAQNTTNVDALEPPHDTSRAAIYYPWINVVETTTGAHRLVPASGHIAGVYARTDIEHGVHKAPANEAVHGAVDLEFLVTEAMQDTLNPRGVNCLRDFRSQGRGIRVWGARTSSSDREWKYINVRRLSLYVEESIDKGTQWVAFEPNGEATWAALRRTITSFLDSMWRSGSLMGATQDEAFFVTCDRTTITPDDINNGRLTCIIGIAPARPAEFVVSRVTKKTADAAG